MIDLPTLLQRHHETSQRAHGQQRHPNMVLADVHAAMRQVESDPLQMFAWVDLVFAALEGGLRSGATSFALAQALATRSTQMANTRYPPQLANQESLKGPGRPETIQEELARLRKLEQEVVRQHDPWAEGAPDAQ